MTKERFTALLQLYYDDKLSEADLQELLTAAEDPAYQVEFEAFIDKGFATGYFKGGTTPDQARKALSLIQLEGAGQHTTAAVVWYRRPTYWAGVASLIFVLAMLLFYLAPSGKVQPQMAVTQKHEDSLHIAPGSQKAILTLSDGSTLALGNGSRPLSLTQGSSHLSTPDTGLLSYQAVPDAAPAGTLYNTVSTPRGGTYRLQLPDGTMVWLNADTKITYPVAFGLSSRSVTVQGEAFFEVAAMAHQPFIVTTTTSQTTVLGTAFNVNAYADRPGSTITLLRGKVQVSATGGSRLLQPGQQIGINAKGAFHQQLVDTSAVVAWKNGMFDFRSTDMATIMYQLEKWYDIHAVLKGGIGSRHFTGVFPRSYDAAVMLRVMQATDLDVTLDGKTLTIAPKKE
jgi:ferric-dicitrate binding protein FerR (iron transport regulator)